MRAVSRTIFVVDDNLTNLVVAKRLLAKDYRTFTMSSAERMFTLLEKLTPDLILLDIDMPVMDGFEALAALKADEKFKGIPVIFLSAREDTESRMHGYELGAADFVSKPFSPPELINSIEAHLRQL
jgi:putative two-component system response regulator